MILFFPDLYQAYGPILALPRFPYVLLAFFPECLNSILIVHVWVHGMDFRRLVWGLTCCLIFSLCMVFKCQYSAAHPHQLEVSHITGEESTQAQAYHSFTLFLCLLAQASQRFVGQLIIYSEDYILGVPERATNRFLL